VKTILVATDLSPRADRAIRRGAALARAAGAELVLLHVLDDDRPLAIIQAERSAADHHLADQARTIAASEGIVCRSRLIVGETLVEIAQAARDVRAELLLVGPHRRSPLKDVFVGTTAERTIRTSPVPVLMVNGEESVAYRRILVAVDLSDASAAAIRALAKLRLASGAELVVLHAFEAVDTSPLQRPSIPADEIERRLPTMRDEADRALAGFLAGLPIQPTRRMTQLVDTDVADTIHGVAAECRADLIVVGTHGGSELATILFGSTARAVLRSATIDVLAVPPHAA